MTTSTTGRFPGPNGLSWGRAAWLLLAAGLLHASAQPLPLVSAVEVQPLVAQVRRLVEAADYLGEPFSQAEKDALHVAVADKDAGRAATTIQQIFDSRCLFGLTIN